MKRATLVAVLAIIPLFVAAYWGIAASNHTNHGGHANHGQPIDGAAVPSEAGQSAFAAIAEIVSMLQSDPHTNWSKVDVNSLREHLVDMNVLTTGAAVTQNNTGKGAVFLVTGDHRTLKAIRSMVPAHSKELNRSTDWEVRAEAAPDGIAMTVESPSDGEQTKIRSLGFFGIMATGAHHQAHHFPKVIHPIEQRFERDNLEYLHLLV